MRLSIITPIYGRVGVFRIWCKAIQAAINAAEKVDIQARVMVAGSEGEKSRSLAEDWAKFDYVEVDNYPLGAKFNAAAMAARDRHNPDYTLILGSDNIICQRYLKAFHGHLKAGIDFIGHVDTYNIDIVRKRALYWPGYTNFRQGTALGSGRFFSNRLLKKLDWQPWDNKKNSSLDYSCDLKLRNIKHTQHIGSIKKMRIFHTGLKSGEDKNPFGIFNNSQLQRLQYLLDHYTIEEVAKDILYYQK